MNLRYAGARGEIPDKDAFLEMGRELSQTIFVAIDPECIMGELHLKTALLHFQRRRRNGKVRSKNESLEIMLCLAGTHQISMALEVCGVDPEKCECVVVWDGETEKNDMLDHLSLQEDPSLLLPEGKKSIFPGPPDGTSDLESWAVEMVNISQLV